MADVNRDEIKNNLLIHIVQGTDLSAISPETRAEYYDAVCESVKLNPLTKPFEFMNLNGKTVLYAKKEATDQLRAIHNINLTIVSRDLIEGVYIVTAKASIPLGGAAWRNDESIGAVSMVYPKKYKDRQGNWKDHPLATKPLDAEERANAIMKAETKAKRRVTLSIVGLGMLDEVEVADIVPPTDSEFAAAAVPAVPTMTPKATPAPVTTSTSPAPVAAPAATSQAPAAPSPSTPAQPEPSTTVREPVTDEAAPPGVDTGNQAAPETGELMPAHRVKMFQVKMQAAGLTAEQFQARFGKPIEAMLKSQSAAIQEFIDSPKG